jgi:hypothetical protein
MERAGDVQFVGKGPENSPLNLTAKEREPGKSRGLCSICEDREVCTFLKPEGGVWHCEEYR